MSDQSPKDPRQNLNISDGASLDNVQIGGIAGRDLNVNQVQQVHQMNVFQNLKVENLRGGATFNQKGNLPQRRVLLNKVKNYWIKDVLEKSLHHQVFIELDFQRQSDAVTRPSSNDQEFPDEPQQTLDTKIADVFVGMGAGRTLLILGEPGSGKTTILLKLLEELIKQIGEDLRKPIPVVFNLSSWGSPQDNKQDKFTKWLIQELNSEYQVSKNLAEELVKKQQLILLLDGLDEVKEEHRRDCVQELNKFRKQGHGETEIVVCSRIQEYQVLSERLILQQAICLQPLTSEQIDWYLNQAGQQLEALRRGLTEDPILQDLSKTPLTLNVMVIVYRGYNSIPELPQIGSLEERREKRLQQLFDAYINRMFRRRLQSKNFYKKYTDEKTIDWLIWLAQKMKVNESIFQIEQIQQEWLPSKNYQSIYRIVVGLLVGLILGLSAGMYFVFYYKLVLMFQHSIAKTSVSIIILITIGILPGLTSGTIAALLYVLPIRQIRGVISGAIFAIFISLLFKYKYPNLFDIYISPYLLIGIFSGATFSLIGKKIEPVETIKPDLNKILITSVFFGILGIIYVFVRFFFLKEIYEPKRYYYMIFEIIIFIIVGVSLGGFRIQRIAPQQGSPNQGIRRAVRYTVITFTSLFFTATFVDWIIDFNLIWSPFLICLGLAIGLLGGLAANEGSGVVSIQHFTLRVILWFKGYLPWNYARFLHYATERIFLRKVGGSYIFIHRMLLEHFARMGLVQVQRSEGVMSSRSQNAA